MKLEHATLSFSEDLTPISKQYDDVYYSRDDGLAESEYVFFNGNNISNRWQQHQRASFYIAETGFGSGLNIAFTMEQFLAFRKANPSHPLKRLYFLSFELHPIALNEFKKIAQTWPQFATFYAAIFQAYPPALAGTYRIHLHESDVVLDLILGDITDTIEQVNQSTNGIDAWYLDGFSPSKNAGMWHENVFKHMRRLSHCTTTFATFTSAGFVKRGLQSAGFDIEKVKGFGRKREMLTGSVDQSNHLHTDTLNPYKRSGSEKQNITVVGAGMAALMVSHALLKRGKRVNLIHKSAIADGASGNPIGGFYPQLQADYSIASQFYWHSFSYAHQYYRALSHKEAFEHEFNGALLLGFNENQLKRFEKMDTQNLWPQSLVEFVSAQQASNIARVTLPHAGLYLNQGGWISPHSLVCALYEQCQKYSDFTAISDTQVTSFESRGDEIKLHLSDTAHDSYQISEALVITTGADTQHLLPEYDWRVTRGQIELLPASENTEPLRTLICHKGYFTPVMNGFHALGSTYHKSDRNTDVQVQDTHANINTHKDAMPQPLWQDYLENAVQLEGAFARASLRCSTPDHLPIAGNVPDIAAQLADYAILAEGKPVRDEPANIANTFVLSGLGSRGLTTSPLCAELLAAQIANEPLPLPQRLLDALNPNRFLIRKLKRGQV